MDDDQELLIKAAELYSSLAESARARFDSRRNLEWKVSIGLWTLFGGAAGVVLTARTWTPGWAEATASLALACMVFYIYATTWISWVNETHRRDSETAYFWESGVRHCIGKVLGEHADLPPYLEPHRDAGDPWPRMSDADPGKIYGNPNKKERTLGKGWHPAHKVQVLITFAFAIFFVGSLVSKSYRSASQGVEMPEFLKTFLLTFIWIVITAIAMGLGVAIAVIIFGRLTRIASNGESLRQGNMAIAVVVSALAIAVALVAATVLGR